MSSPLVYVAGPYSAKTPAGIASNVRRANDVGRDLMRLGFDVVVPHQLGQGIDADSSLFGEQRWYDLTMRVMLLCDAVVMMQGWQSSRGACAERQRALDAGMVVYEAGELL